MRTPRTELQRAAVEALVEACQEVGLEVTVDGERDVVIRRSSGQPLEMEVKARAVADVGPWFDEPPDRPVVVVADVVTSRVRRAYREHGIGWLDRRGHLRLNGYGLLIETELAPLPRDRPDAEGPGSDAFGRGRATIEVALALLLHPRRPRGVRELARQVDLAPSTISKARERLGRALLITSEGEPLVPELFWELAERWRPRWHPLAKDPDAGSPEPSGVRHDAWVRTGDAAAAIHGAPLAVGTAAPGSYYVATSSDLRQARRSLGDADPAEAACRVAVAPSRLVIVEAETDESMVAPWTGPLAPRVVVALDLAQDPTRGREILRSWQPTEKERKAVWLS